VATILLDDGAVSINTERPFVFTSGIVSPIYCDLRLLMTAPQHRERIVELLVERILESYRDSGLDVIAGVATAGIPWAAWVAAKMNKAMVYVRDAAKGHGKGQQVEGGVSGGQVAVVLEDLTSSGGSALNATEVLRTMGARVDHCYSIYTYGFPLAREAYNRARVELVSLCKVSTLLEVAAADGRINRGQERAVREWLASGPLTASRVDQANP